MKNDTEKEIQTEKILPEQRTKKKTPQNRSKKAKSWKRRKFINRLFWVLFFSSVIAMIVMLFNVYSKYRSTLDWEKDNNTVTMANQSLDLLYDDNELSKENKILFMNLKDEMLLSDGRLTDKVNKTNLNALKYYLENINTDNSEIDYQSIYAEIALKYSLISQLNNLFEDGSHTRLKSEVTPATLAQLSNDTFPALALLFTRNHDDIFVEDYLEEQSKFSQDVETFNLLVDTFTNAVTISGNKLKINDNYRDNLSEQMNVLFNQLNYKWSSTGFMMKATNLLQPVILEIMDDYKKYHEYETDIANKNEAYTYWNDEQQAFFAEVQSIRNEALARKEERERQERLAQELDETKPRAVELINSLSEITADMKRTYIASINAAQTIEELNTVINQARDMNEELIKEKEAQESSETELSTTESSIEESTDESTNSSRESTQG